MLKYGFPMNILILIISFCLAADASVLIVNPSLYRRSLEYINESIGNTWSLIYGLLFALCTNFILISIIFSGISMYYLLAAIVMAFPAIFFLMAGTQKYSYFINIWISLSNLQFRIAGIVFVILATIACYVSTCVQ